MKKTPAIIFSTLLFVSCSGVESEFSPPVSLRLTIRAGLPPVAIAVDEFARLAAERSHKTMTIAVGETRHAADDRKVVKKLAAGEIDVACVGAQELSALDAEFAVLTLPFLFRGDAHFRRVINGPVGESILKGLDRHGLTGIGFFDQGALHFFSRDKKLILPADFKKTRFRIPSLPPLRGAIERLGGFVAPVPGEEAAQALKLGIVDAVGDFPWAFERYGSQTAAMRVSSLGCARAPLVLVMSGAAARKLPSGAIEFLRAAARDAATGQRASAHGDDESVAALAARGVTVDRPVDVSAFAALIGPVYREQPEEVRKLIKEIDDMR
ncbi:MAG: TRAP transporter substrate-binding protein DctP [Spirochaetales bacterium]|nr:TRAP transporter substrate-binding protein DctP [Spirochaetales bacterium]